jgi:hypothetical protein
MRPQALGARFDDHGQAHVEVVALPAGIGEFENVQGHGIPLK